MIELLIFGLMLGWGAAIPIGAMNLEIIRRNLRFGIFTGFALGIGACLADMTYILLLSYGALQLLNSVILLKIIGMAGSLILAWFGWCALHQTAIKLDHHEMSNQGRSNSYLKHLSEGYILTLINPYTILFWSSVSLTIAANTRTEHGTLYAGLGVLLGVLSWIIALNVFLHITRHHISKKVMHKINYIGGIMLIILALLGLWHAYTLEIATI